MQGFIRIAAIDALLRVSRDINEIAFDLHEAHLPVV